METLRPSMPLVRRDTASVSLTRTDTGTYQSRAIRSQARPALRLSSSGKGADLRNDSSQVNVPFRDSNV
jgi:hypothetical protein